MPKIPLLPELSSSSAPPPIVAKKAPRTAKKKKGQSSRQGGQGRKQEARYEIPMVDAAAALQDPGAWLMQMMEQLNDVAHQCASVGSFQPYGATVRRILDVFEKLQERVKPDRPKLLDISVEERLARVREACRYWPIEVLEVAEAELERRRNDITENSYRPAPGAGPRG